MSGKKIDFLGMMGVYENISKKRPLEEHEMERFLHLKRKYLLQQSAARYREKNKELLKQKKKEWREKNPEKARLISIRSSRNYRKTPQGRLKTLETNNRSRHRYRDRDIARKAQYRLENEVKTHILVDGRPLCNNPKANLINSVLTKPANCHKCLLKRNKRQRESLNV